MSLGINLGGVGNIREGDSSGGEPILEVLSGDNGNESSLKDSGGDNALTIRVESFVSEYSTAPSLIAWPTNEPGSKMFLLTSSKGPGRMSSLSLRSSCSFFRFKLICVA